MKHGAMANRRVIADVHARITVRDAAILHVAAIANHDRLIVIAENQMRASCTSTTLPMTWVVGASQTSSPIN